MRTDALHAEPAPESALARVLALEIRLDAVLADATAEAEEIVRLAEARAHARMGELESELEQARVEAEARLAREREARLTRLQADSDGALAALGALNQDQVEDLAAWVVQRILAPPREGAA